MYIIATHKTPNQVLGRLTEVERSMIRSASDDRLEYLRQTQHAADMISAEDMATVRAVLKAEYAENSKSDLFGRTWNF